MQKSRLVSKGNAPAAKGRPTHTESKPNRNQCPHTWLDIDVELIIHSAPSDYLL